MRLFRLPEACVALILLFSASTVDAQFTFPPPLDRPLSDYTSGEVTSGLNFSAGDSMFGGWSTPGRLASFMLYRCVHTPTSDPICPSNSSFNSRSGSEAPDGTWEQMPLYEGFDNAFGNGFNSGRNSIWLHGEFIAPNETTGDLCWFELYPGYDEVSYENGPERIAEVNGGGDWYFATVPFTVNPRRPSDLTVTWRGSTPTRDIFRNSSDSDAIYQEFPELVRSGGSDSDSSGSSLSPNAGAFLVVPLLLYLYI